MPAVSKRGGTRSVHWLPATCGTAEALGKVIADAQCVGDRRQPRVNSARGREEAGVDDVQVVEVVRLAVEVKRRALGIGAESHRPAVMGDAGERDLLA